MLKHDLGDQSVFHQVLKLAEALVPWESEHMSSKGVSVVRGVALPWADQLLPCSPMQGHSPSKTSVWFNILPSNLQYCGK